MPEFQGEYENPSAKLCDEDVLPVEHQPTRLPISVLLSTVTMMY